MLATYMVGVHKAAAHYWPHCRKEHCKRHVVRPYFNYWQNVASCESGRRWHIATGNGFYGGLQFTLGSWRAVGGYGMPNYAPRYEQMYRATILLHVQGRGAWPVCG